MKEHLCTKTKTVMKGFRYRMYPTLRQQDLFVRTFGSARFVYNKLLREKIDHYARTRKTLRNTPAHLKKDFPWLAEVDSLALCNAQLDLERAFENFFRDKSVGFPRFKHKKHPKRKYTTNMINGNIKLSPKNSSPVYWLLQLPKAGFVSIKYHRPLPEGWKLKSATVELTGGGEWYVSLLCDSGESVAQRKGSREIPPERTIGLDFSLPKLYVSSTGESPALPARFYREGEPRLAREGRKLSRCRRGSKNYQKQKKKLAREQRRIADRRRDFLHKESRRIANAFDIVCTENLDMKAMAQTMSFGKSVSDNGWGMFVNFLGYKLAERGGSLVKADRMYPSSKLCSSCGAKKESLKRSERIYTCGFCGAVADRDINAAVNIRAEGLRILRQNEDLAEETQGRKRQKNREKLPAA